MQSEQKGKQGTAGPHHQDPPPAPRPMLLGCASAASSWNSVRGSEARWLVSPWGPCSLSLPAGTHVFKTADRSSLVTVVLQELPPVEPQDQRCGHKEELESGVWRSGSSPCRSLAPGGLERQVPLPPRQRLRPPVPVPAPREAIGTS